LCLQQPAMMMTFCDAVLQTQLSAPSVTAILVSEICLPPLLSHSLCGRQQGQIQALSAWKCRKTARPPLLSHSLRGRQQGQIQALSAWKCRKTARPPILSHSLRGHQQGQIQALSAWKCRKSARPLSSLIASAAVNRGRSRLCRRFMTKIWD